MEESPVRNKTIANYNKVLETIYTKVQDHVKSIWVDDEKVTHQKIFYLLATREESFPSLEISGYEKLIEFAVEEIRKKIDGCLHVEFITKLFILDQGFRHFLLEKYREFISTVINSTSAQQNDPFHILQTQISRCFRDYYCDSFIEGEKVEAKLVDLGLDALKIEKNIVTFSDEELIMISEEYRCLPPPNPKIIRASRNVQKKELENLRVEKGKLEEDYNKEKEALQVEKKKSEVHEQEKKAWKGMYEEEKKKYEKEKSSNESKLQEISKNLQEIKTQNEVTQKKESEDMNKFLGDLTKKNDEFLQSLQAQLSNLQFQKFEINQPPQNFHPTIKFVKSIEGFESPWGVAYGNNGVLYISDTDAQKISIFQNETKSNFVKFDLKPFPRDLSINSNGDVFVVLSSFGQIQHCYKNGNLGPKIGAKGRGKTDLNIPRSVAVGGDYLYITDTESHRIQVFGQNGHYVHSFGKSGSGPSEFQFPLCISHQKDLLAVTDCDNHRVQIFDRKTYELKFHFGTHGNSSGQFNKPIGIAFDQRGNIVVGDSENHRIQIFSPQGNFLAEFGQSGSNDGDFNGPRGLDVSQNGQIAIADFGNKRVQIFQITY